MLKQQGALERALGLMLIFRHFQQGSLTIWTTTYSKDDLNVFILYSAQHK